MKKKLIAGVLATVTVVGGVIPTTNAFADVKELDNQLVVENMQEILQIKNETTTESAVQIDETQDFTENKEIILDEQQEIEISKVEVKELKATLDENITIGEKAKVKVKGFDTNGNELKLDKEKITYEWFANNEMVGNENCLDVTSDMENKEISCKVSYRN